jgi:hypothetical protein
MTSAAVAATMTATVATTAMPSVPAMSMTSTRGTIGSNRRTSATASQIGRVDRPPIAPRAEGARIKPLRLLRSVSFIPGAAQHMRIVVNHSAEQSVAVSRVLRRVKNVLMPELIQIVLAILGRPRNQHEAGPELQQRQKANIFSPGSFGPFKRPAPLFDQGVAYRVEFEFLGDPAACLCGEQSFQSRVGYEPHYEEDKDKNRHCLCCFLVPPIGTCHFPYLCRQDRLNDSKCQARSRRFLRNFHSKFQAQERPPAQNSTA